MSFGNIVLVVKKSSFAGGFIAMDFCLKQTRMMTNIVHFHMAGLVHLVFSAQHSTVDS